jgi:hypothetical protein
MGISEACEICGHPDNEAGNFLVYCMGSIDGNLTHFVATCLTEECSSSPRLVRANVADIKAFGARLHARTGPIGAEGA